MRRTPDIEDQIKDLQNRLDLLKKRVEEQTDEPDIAAKKLPKLTDEERAAMSSLGGDFIQRLLAGERPLGPPFPKLTGWEMYGLSEHSPETMSVFFYSNGHTEVQIDSDDNRLVVVLSKEDRVRLVRQLAKIP